VRQCKFKKKRLVGAALKKFGFRKGVVPDWIWTGNEKTQWQYIRGLLYTDGTVCVGKSAGNPLQLSLSSVDKEFLGRVQLILANLGVPSAIHILRRAGKSVLPDGRGSHKAYDTKDCWRLCVSNKAARLQLEEGAEPVKDAKGNLKDPKPPTEAQVQALMRTDEVLAPRRDAAVMQEAMAEARYEALRADYRAVCTEADMVAESARNTRQELQNLDPTVRLAQLGRSWPAPADTRAPSQRTITTGLGDNVEDEGPV
jgi:hypothetical protein